MALDREYVELLESRRGFSPQSPSAALIGVHQGILPESMLVYLGVNVRPVFEEPYDLLELEKLLAKPDLTLETVQLLMKVFSYMTKNPDKEVALFAAESINALEVRCRNFVQVTRRSYEADSSESGGRRLFEALVGMGVISGASPVLQEFYLREALDSLAEFWSRFGPSTIDLPLAVQAHLDLRQPEKAEALVQTFIERQPQEGSLYVQMARIKFYQGDFPQVIALLHLIRGHTLGAREKEIAEFWVGGSRG